MTHVMPLMSLNMANPDLNGLVRQQNGPSTGSNGSGGVNVNLDLSSISLK